MKKSLLIATAIVLFASPYSFSQNVAVNTYYPAPFGTYDQLRLVPRSDTGILSNPCRVGMMYYSTNPAYEFKLRFCGEIGAGPEAGAWIEMPQHWDVDPATHEVYLVDTTFVQNFKVGVGDRTPDAAMEVSNNGQGYDLFMASSDDGANGDVFIVKGNGNVGINDVNPPDTLTVNGGGASVLERLSVENGSTGSAWLRVTETNFRGGYVEYANAGGYFYIGAHNANNRSTGSDIDSIRINRQTGIIGAATMLQDMSTGGDMEVIGDVNVDGGRMDVGPTNDLGAVPAQELNVRGGINIREGGTWGRLAVEYSNGSYYGTFAP